MIAGPSEVTVHADKFSEPAWVAADLIAQIILIYFTIDID